MLESIPEPQPMIGEGEYFRYLQRVAKSNAQEPAPEYCIERAKDEFLAANASENGWLVACRMFQALMGGRPAKRPIDNPKEGIRA